MGVATWLLLALGLAVLLAWLVARFYLDGPPLAAFDDAEAEAFPDHASVAQREAVLQRVRTLRQSTAAVPLRRRLAATRAAWEQLFAGQAPEARFLPMRADGLTGEWVLAPGADAGRRILYLHGGAYMLGSPQSHRSLTVALSRLAGAAVLALDYRLMPEHARRDGIDDCRQAWRWLLAHGPQGEETARQAFVAGDSAGGNLALALAVWIRDQGLRAPDAVAALSPQTDCTMASPTLRANLPTDPMLGPSFRPLLRLPRTLLLWAIWLQHRMRPCAAAMSPVFADLAGLPPTLVQASASEMLAGDARRYAGRARAAGSMVKLQLWDDQVHVWQLFAPELAPANEALVQVARFFEEAAPPESPMAQTPSA